MIAFANAINKPISSAATSKRRSQEVGYEALALSRLGVVSSNRVKYKGNAVEIGQPTRGVSFAGRA
jgi:hypothetical protein